MVVAGPGQFPAHPPARAQAEFAMADGEGKAAPHFRHAFERGSDQGGASTSMVQSCDAFKVMNRLFAMTMSPTQDGPTTRICFILFRCRRRGA